MYDIFEMVAWRNGKRVYLVICKYLSVVSPKPIKVV